MVEGVHDRDKAIVSSEISAVIEDVLDFREIRIAFWRLLKPMIFDLLDFECAVSRELREPADRVAFLNPELEPRKLVTFFDIKTLPNESLLALPAPKTLLMIGGKAVMLDVT